MDGIIMTLLIMPIQDASNHGNFNKFLINIGMDKKGEIEQLRQLSM
jgi:hypothetical protein